MGCDIHMVLQIQHKDKWKTIEEISLHRDYELFGILAGVRSRTHRPISEARGLPKDVDVNKGYEIKYLHLSYDGIRDRLWLGNHSHSYLTAKELVKYKWDKVEDSLDGQITRLLDRLRYLPAKDLDRVRIVFGFDS